MRPETTVFVEEVGGEVRVFVWSESAKAFVIDLRWRVLSDGASEPHEQPFTVEGWFDQPTQVRSLTGGRWYLVQFVPEGE